MLLLQNLRKSLFAFAAGVLVLELLHSSHNLSGNVSSAVASPLSSERGNGRIELRVELAHVVRGEDSNVIGINDLSAASGAVVIEGRGDESQIFVEFEVIFLVLLIMRQVESLTGKSLNNIFLKPEYLNIISR